MPFSGISNYIILSPQQAKREERRARSKEKYVNKEQQQLFKQCNKEQQRNRHHIQDSDKTSINPTKKRLTNALVP
jgi:hypothetical protein